MSQRACRLLLVVFSLAAPLPVLAQAASADSTAAPRLRIALGGELASMDAHDVTLLSPVDAVGWKLHAPKRAYQSGSQETIVVQHPGVACPMPVAVPAPNATVPMPNATPGFLTTVPMPTERAGCFNPLYQLR